MKSLKELIGEEKCYDFLIASNFEHERAIEILPSFSEMLKWYSVKDKLPPWGQRVWCLFPPITNSFYGVFQEEEYGWVCYPENGGWLGDEDELIWCELNAKGELEF